MIYGIGIDIVEVARIEKSLKNNQGFKEKVFTEKEIQYCDSRTFPHESYAARFAAKEAFLKALGTGWAGDMQLDEIEILNEKEGKPVVFLYGVAKSHVAKEGINSIFISLSHIASNASAVVVLEK